MPDSSEQRYTLIFSDTSEQVLAYLRRKNLAVRTYGFNPILDLSDVHFRDRENGWYDDPN